jgi:PAS domain S-box-containing protein
MSGRTVEQQLAFQAHLLDVVEQAIIAVDLKGIVLFWNRYAEQMYGWSAREAVGKSLRSMLTPADSVGRAEAIMNRLRTGASWSGEFIVHDKAGHEFVVEVTNSPIFDDDGVLVGVIGVSRDATDRLQYEEALRASEEFNRSILESSTDCIKVLELDGKLVSMNGPGLCALETDDFTSFKGSPWPNLWEGDGKAMAHKALADARSGGVGHFTAPCKTARGNLKYWDVIVTPMVDASGAPKRLVSVSRDVTQQHLSVAELQRNADQFRALFYLSAIGKAEIDYATGQLRRVNGRLCEIFGYPESELAGAKLEDLIYPGDVAIGQLGRAAVGKHLQWTGNSEYRIIRKDKTVRWVEAHISLINSGHGSPVYVIAAIQDVTDRKRAEREQQLLATLGPVLSQAKGVDDIAQGAANAIVPIFGDWCAVGIMDGEDAVRIIAEAHSDALTEGIRVGERFDFGGNGSSLPSAHTGKIELYRRMSDADFERLHSSRRIGFSGLRQQGLHSLLFAPLAVRDQLVGVIAFGLIDGSRDFHDDDVKTAGEISRRIAIGFENIRLYKELQDINADLENRVAQRTEAFRASRDQLRNLAKRLQVAREEERLRVSREVHDVIGQILTGLKMDVSSLGRQLQRENSAAVAKIGEINVLLDEAIKSARRVATDLRPAVLDNFGLVAAVEWHLREFEMRSGIACTFDCAVENVPLTGDDTTAVFRLIQEALTNVARHSKAAHAVVSIGIEQDVLKLQIRDDGKGITEQDLVGSRSLGLLGMRERVHLLHGKISFQGKPACGTTVAVDIPLTSPGARPSKAVSGAGEAQG